MHANLQIHEFAYSRHSHVMSVIRIMLLEFYGKECSHCIAMRPPVERLEKETGVGVEKYEVWHDEANAKKMEEYDTGLCGGVPFFSNTETKEYICGETSYEELRAWASPKKK